MTFCVLKPFSEFKFSLIDQSNVEFYVIGHHIKLKTYLLIQTPCVIRKSQKKKQWMEGMELFVGMLERDGSTQASKEASQKKKRK